MLTRPEGVTASRRRKCGENITITDYAFGFKDVRRNQLSAARVLCAQHGHVSCVQKEQNEG